MIQRITNLLAYLLTSHGKAQLGGALLLIFAYWLIAVCRNQLDWTKVFLFAMKVVGLFTGFYVLVGAFRVVDTSLDVGVWGGITGACIILFSLTEVIQDFRKVAQKKRTTPRSRTIADASSKVVRSVSRDSSGS